MTMEELRMEELRMEPLRDDILEALIAMKGSVGFYYKNMVTGKTFGFRQDEEFPSASVIKLPMLLQILKWEAEGKADLAETIRVRQEEKMPPSGALTFFTGEPEVDVLTLCRLMICLSDNTATNILMKRYGVAEFEKGFGEMGLEKTHLRRLLFDAEGAARGLCNVFCPRELGELLERLYRGSFVSGKVSRKALEILMQQQVRHKIAGMFPESTLIANKTGEDDGLTNDVGLLYAKQPFVVCFAGNGVDVPRFEQLIRETAYRLYLAANQPD